VTDKGTGGEVANALVCKTSIHGFKSHPVLQTHTAQRKKKSIPFSTQDYGRSIQYSQIAGPSEHILQATHEYSLYCRYRDRCGLQARGKHSFKWSKLMTRG
jgi:hypothetical protein